MWEFAGEHPFATVIIAWLVATSVTAIVSRTWRMVMVAFRGWPPAHLDADGDWKPAPEQSVDTGT